MSTLVKDSRSSFDLALMPTGALTSSVEFWAKCKQGRRPPLTPDEFEVALGSRSFTSKKADLPKVVALYKHAFTTQMAAVTFLNLEELGWRDEEARQLARVLASGACVKLVMVNLIDNRIGDAGVHALAAAVATIDASGRYVSPLLTEIVLSGNRASSAAMASLSRYALQERKDANDKNSRQKERARAEAEAVKEIGAGGGSQCDGSGRHVGYGHGAKPCQLQGHL